MGKSIILNDIAAKSVIELAKKRVDEIDREISKLNELREERKSLLSTIDQLNNGNATSMYDPNYQATWTWFQKAKHILILAGGKEMTTREIVDEILNREPSLERRRVVSAISSILSTTKDEIIVIGKNDRGEKTYFVDTFDFNESRPAESVSKDDLPF